MNQILPSILLICIPLVLSGSPWTNVTVKGTVICEMKRQRGVRVELYDRDVLSYNDKLAAVWTDKNGEFILSGGEYERGIEPFVLFYHKCRAEKNCFRLTYHNVPSSYLNGVYDMDLIPLDPYTDQEKSLCD